MSRNNCCLIILVVYIFNSVTEAVPLTCGYGECGDSKQPVCGSDGITYDNVCQLLNTKCKSKSTLTIKDLGVCPKDLIFQRKQRTPNCVYNCSVKDPVCGTDGLTYGSSETGVSLTLDRPRPWRETIDWSNPKKVSEELFSELENYSPGQDCVERYVVDCPHANILLLGPVGAGKSSFINTVSSIFRRRMTLQTRCGNASKSLTTKLRKYHIQSTETGRPVNFIFHDMMGLESNSPVTNTNFKLLLEGSLKDNTFYDFSSRVSKYRHGFNPEQRLGNKIHCVAILVDASSVECMSESMPDVVQNIKDLQTLRNSLDIPQVILLTKIDNVCEKTKMDISFAYLSERVKECVSKVSDIFGLPRNVIFPIKNYEEEGKLSTNVNILTMYTLTKILEQVDAVMLNRIEEIKAKPVAGAGEGFMDVMYYIINMFRWLWPSR